MSYYDNSKELDQIADLQATIADLQGQLEAAKKKVELATAKAPRVYDCGSCAIGKGFEQRVAQLEGDVEEQKRNYLNACETIYKMYVAATGREGVAPKRGVVEDLADLQADHARVLGLVQEIVNAGVSMEDPRIAYKEVQIDREWFARAAASLPAQPAQGIIDRMAHINDGCECRICKPQPAQGGAGE